MTNNAFGLPDEMQPAIQRSIGDGVIEGIQAFFRRNLLKVEPGTNNAKPVVEFVTLLTAEMQDDPEDKTPKRLYPFSRSFRSAWEEAVTDISPVLIKLWENKEEKEAVVLSRTISYLETFKFLEDNAKEMISKYNAIRGEDLPASAITLEKPKPAQ